MIAEEFIKQGFCISKVLKLCEVPKSSYYFKPNEAVKQSKKGIYPSIYTSKTDGSILSNSIVLEDIRALLALEFVDYGYLKTTYYLQDEKGYKINHKKVAVVIFIFSSYLILFYLCANFFFKKIALLKYLGEKP